MKVRYFGNFISHNQSDSKEVALKIATFISQGNMLNNKFSTISSLVWGSLLQMYCCSWYGSQTWDISSEYVRQLSVEWNKAVRRTPHIPNTTSTRLLPRILTTSSFMDRHARHVPKFICAFLTAQNGNNVLIGFRTWLCNRRPGA